MEVTDVEEQTTHERWPSRAWRWAVDRPLRQVVIGVGLVLLLLTAPFGGLAAAPVERVEPIVLKPGQEVTAGPLRVRFESAKWNTDPSKTFSPSKVGAYVLVFAQVRSTDPDMVPLSIMEDFVRITNLDNLTASMIDETVAPAATVAPSAYNAEDSTAQSTLGAGITYRMAFIFQTRGTTLPDTLELQTFDWTWREDFTNRQFAWLDRVPKATISLPLTENTKHAHEETP